MTKEKEIPYYIIYSIEEYKGDFLINCHTYNLENSNILDSVRKEKFSTYNEAKDYYDKLIDEEKKRRAKQEKDKPFGTKIPVFKRGYQSKN